MSQQDAVALLHNHDFMIRSDPEYASHSFSLHRAEEAKFPKGVSPVADTKVYDIVGKGSGLAQYTNLEDGLFVHNTFPAGVHLDTQWRVETADGGINLVYDSTVSCSKLLVGTAQVNLKKYLDGVFDKIMASL